MGVFSNLFTPRPLSAEEVAANKMILLKERLRDLTLRLTHKRITMQEGGNVMPLENLQRLSDYELSSLPENSIVTMAGIYRRCIGEGGCTHEVALQIVNSTRALPVQWKDASKFQTLEEYIVERLKVELAAPSLSSTVLKYYTHDFISNSIQETNLVFHEIFGFGMSEKEKWYLGQVEILMTPVAMLIEKDVKPLAKEMFDATKAEVIAQYGQNIYAENMGDNIIANQKDYVDKRLAAGLTIYDIQRHWNQPLLMQVLQNKIEEMFEFVSLLSGIARLTGKSADKLTADEMTMSATIVTRDKRKTMPRWGDPEKWSSSLPLNEGFTLEDADLYIEFMGRVARWRETVSLSEAEEKKLISHFSSYNAMVRDRIRKKFI